jgi:hypothetical protein
MSEIAVARPIESRIFLIRGKRVMLDRDLADLYGVETRVLNQAVKRNAERFPDDFMFQLTRLELDSLKSHIVISSWGGIRKMPFAFTDYGVAMLSGVLNSATAIRINLDIMRAFVRLREIAMQDKEVWKAIQRIEKRLGAHDQQIQIAFSALKSLLQPRQVPAKSEYSPEGKKAGFRLRERKSTD